MRIVLIALLVSASAATGGAAIAWALTRRVLRVIAAERTSADGLEGEPRLEARDGVMCSALPPPFCVILNECMLVFKCDLAASAGIPTRGYRLRSRNTNVTHRVGNDVHELSVRKLPWMAIRSSNKSSVPTQFFEPTATHLLLEHCPTR